MTTQNIDLATLDEAAVQAQSEILAQLLREARPTLDVSPGTVIRQLVVNSSALFTELNENNLARLRSANSLLTATETPDTADASVVDQILSNHLVTRRAAKSSAGRVVIVLSQAITTPMSSSQKFTSLDGTVSFTVTDSFIGVTSVESVSSTGDRLITSRPGGLFGFVVDVVADVPGAAGDVRRGTRFVPAPRLAAFVDAYAESDFTQGVGQESTPELLARMELGIAAKAVSDRVSTVSLLQQNFPALQDVSLIGFGDSEMFRDRTNLFGESTGGKVDVYVRTRGTPLVTHAVKSAVLVSKSLKLWRLNFTRDEFPGMYRVESVLPKDSLAVGSFEVVSDTRSLDTSAIPGEFIPRIVSAAGGNYTRYQTAAVTFRDTLTDTTELFEGLSRQDYDIAVSTMPDLAELQTFVASRDRRAPGTDYAVRAAIPCFVSCGLVVYYRREYGVPDVEVIRDRVTDTVNAIKFSEPRLSVSLIVNTVHSVIGQNGYVDLPVDLRGALLLPGGSTVAVADTDALVIPEYPELGVSRRTVAFFLSREQVSIDLRPVTQWQT